MWPHAQGIRLAERVPSAVSIVASTAAGESLAPCGESIHRADQNSPLPLSSGNTLPSPAAVVAALHRPFPACGLVPGETPLEGSNKQTPRGNTHDLRPIYPPHLRPPGTGHIGLQVFMPLAYLTVASYAVRVPRVRASPTASFPHCLTTLQLLFSSGFLSPSLPENSHLLVTSSFGFHLWVPSAMPGAQTKEAVLIRTLPPLRCSRNGTRFIYSYTALAVWRCRCQ